MCLVAPACLELDHFGKWKESKILSFSIENQIGNVLIDHEALTITALVDESSDLTQLKAVEIKTSSFAKVVPASGQILDFSEPLKFIVTAEDGSQSEYTAYVKYSQAEIQLDNSNMSDWYETGGSKKYLEPGTHKETTLWGTGNAGVVTLGSANVMPITEGTNTYALLKTAELKLGALLGQGIGAGSLFTGTFVLNLNNPISSPKFGINYSARPKTVALDYKYSPGSVVKDGKLVVLPQAKDSCDIYVQLSNRAQEPYKQVAVAAFRSGSNVTEWHRLKLDFKYGPIANAAPYEKPRGVWISEGNGVRQVPQEWGTGNEKPTHLTIIFSSSHRGDYFEGAPGSELSIDNLELIYP